MDKPQIQFTTHPAEFWMNYLSPGISNNSCCLPDGFHWLCQIFIGGEPFIWLFNVILVWLFGGHILGIGLLLVVLCWCSVNQLLTCDLTMMVWILNVLWHLWLILAMLIFHIRFFKILNEGSNFLTSNYLQFICLK